MLAVTFDPAVVEAAVSALSPAGREDLESATESLHESQSYADICDYFSDTLANGSLLGREGIECFRVTGIDVKAEADFRIEPVVANSEMVMEGVAVIAHLKLIDGPNAYTAHKTIRYLCDKVRDLRGDDRDPGATLLAIGRNVADRINAELAAADKFVTART